VTRYYTIHLPVGLELLNSNQRLHRAVRSRMTASIRAAAMRACSEDDTMRAALVAAGDAPLLQRAYILGVLHPASRRRADPANWYPSFKAAVDGLVDAGVLEDDDHSHLVGPDMRIGPVVRGARLTLFVQEITAAEHAAFQWRTAS
jgi:crossover junction endodeoxyribonuclease RusA